MKWILPLVYSGFASAALLGPGSANDTDTKAEGGPLERERQFLEDAWPALHLKVRPWQLRL